MATYTEKERPYVSVIVAARNDDHGGNMLRRMQAFINAWIGQAREYRLPSEIIIVEWNPPDNRPRLIDALEWPPETGPCDVRFLEVSPEVHRQFKHADAIPLHQMIAKNAGIRRALGEFVLATNLDIVLSAEVMRFMADRRLEKRKMYRMDRTDVANNVPIRATSDQLVQFCENHMVKVFNSEGGFDLGPDGLLALEANDIVGRDAGFRFGSGWYPVDRGSAEPFRWMAREADLLLYRPSGVAPCLLMEAEVGPSAGGAPIVLDVQDPLGPVLASATLEGRCRLRLHIPDQISTGKLRFRIQGGGVPLSRDARFLDLRFFEIMWEGGPRSSQFSRWRPADNASEASICVRSVEPQRAQLALNAGPGAILEGLEIHLSDSSGNVVFHSAASLPPSQLNRCLLTLRVGFKYTGHCAENDEAKQPEPFWRLDVVDSWPGEDWSTAFATPSPFAQHMRNAAYLHTNGCGDFTLLSRDDWFSLRGYPEFPIWPSHLDSLLCYAAHHAGIQEVVLREPMRMFHIQHQTTWSPDDEKDRHAKAAAKGIAIIANDDVVKWIDRMRRFNAPAIFAQSNWGLADIELPETAVPILAKP
ncbi:MAG TPA: hypothetical protein VEU96_19810 [Bryobacteraceae bacterium]|nr:hypothetical protein [Bryobacteraceae bacterium]